MADRYYVGGTGNWSNTAHWSATSGGSGGASVPTSADSVYFDANSFSSTGQTVTIDTYADCFNMDWTGVSNSPTLSLNYSINIYGSLTLTSAVNSIGGGGSMSFKATSTGKTITTAGKTITSPVIFSGAGGEWTLQDGLNAGAQTIYLYKGTLRSNDKNITCGKFESDNADIRALYLGSSVVTCSNDWHLANVSNLTFSAGASTIKITPGDSFYKVFYGAGQTYYNVELIDCNILGSNTFNDLKFTAGKGYYFEEGTTQTITTLSGDGTSGSLITMQSTSAGSAFTLSKTSGTVQRSYYSIKDCTANGGARWAASNSTNVSGNTGWLFGAYVDVADTGSGADSASILATIATIADGHQHTQRMAIGMGYAFDPAIDSGYGVDTASILASLTASDTGHGLDVLLPIEASISANDIGHGVDIGSVAKAFFLIDSHNILQPLGVFVLRDSREELAPTTRNNVDTVPGRHGEFDFGSEFEARVMELKVHINTTPETKTALKRTLAAYLNPLLGIKPLIDSRDLEKTYYVKYAGKTDLTNYVNALQFTIPFKASDPIVYGSFEQTQVGSGTITNDGTLECPIKITIVGAVTNPSVVVGSYTLTYAGTLTISDTLIVDTGALTCTLNGVNALGNLTGLSPDVVLAVGDTVVAAPVSGTTTFTWNERWT